MTRAQTDAINRAVWSVQAIALILRAIGDGEKSVDPGAVEWLGERLTEAHETIDEAARHARLEGGA